MVSPEAWVVMRQHAERDYPRECCGAFLGRDSRVSEAIPLENAYAGSQADRYELRPEDLIRVERRAREQGLEMLGVYHSHPDDAAYFSKTDLENSVPWLRFIVISVRGGQEAGYACFQPDEDLSAAAPVTMRIG